MAIAEVPTLPSAPSFPSSSRRYRRAIPSATRGGEGSESEERRVALLRVRRLEEQIQDLREAYAKKIARTELACEQLMREKDDTSSAWYKARKVEIAKLQAGVTIMKAMFEKRRSRYESKMHEELQEFERQKEAFRVSTQQMKDEHRLAMQSFECTVKEQSQAYEKQIEEISKQRAAGEEANRCLEEHVSLLQSSEKKLLEANDALHREVGELRRRVREVERTEELAARNAQIEALEAELRRIKKVTQDKRHAEIEALQKELMEYVKFIVRILPDDWQSQGGRLALEEMPKDVRERLRWPTVAAPYPALGDQLYGVRGRSASPPSPSSGLQALKALPPVKAAPSSGMTARPLGSIHMSSPRPQAR